MRRSNRWRPDNGSWYGVHVLHIRRSSSFNAFHLFAASVGKINDTKKEMTRRRPTDHRLCLSRAARDPTSRHICRPCTVLASRIACIYVGLGHLSRGNSAGAERVRFPLKKRSVSALDVETQISVFHSRVTGVGLISMSGGTGWAWYLVFLTGSPVTTGANTCVW
jgi:hypothetical protein